MEQQQSLPSVYRYTDSLAFINDAKERLNKTYSSLAEELGISSRTKIKKIFKGGMSIPKQTLQQLGEKFGLDKNELTYLDSLRVFNQTEDAETAVTLFAKLVHFRKKHHIEYDNHELDQTQLTLLKKWYYLPILYFLGIKKVDPTPFSIVKGFHGKLSMDEVQDAITVLLDINLVKYTPEGKLIPVHQSVNLLDGIPRPLIKRFHSMMIKKAEESVYGLPINKRYLMSATINIEKNMIPKIQERILKFIVDLDEDFSSNDANSIYQANIQLFNIAEVAEIQ